MPTPVVVCSGLAARGTELALRALEEGAVEVITKPKVACGRRRYRRPMRDEGSWSRYHRAGRSQSALSSGCPKRAISRGTVNVVMPLEQIANAVLKPQSK